ncbi:MAG: hypothetical protein ABFD50_19405 [Smithella sp.]
MRNMEIIIENDKSAFLEVKNSSNNFGLFSKSQSDFLVGFENDPLFEISHSLVNERWFFDVSTNGKKIPHENIIFDEPADRWLKDSCCSDFSILNFLPDGQYRLVKTSRKTRFTNEILYGNEWEDTPQNILTFEGVNIKDQMLTGTLDRSGKQKYYPLIIGGNIDCAPAINQPLLCTILLDYGIVWDGATGFIFFSFNDNSEPKTMEQQKKIILLLPYSDTFIIDCMSRKNHFNKKVIDDFIKII